MRLLTKYQQNTIIEEIIDGNPFHSDIAHKAKCRVSTVKRYRQHVKTGKFPMCEELKV